jgi:hypothetical protein
MSSLSSLAKTETNFNRHWIKKIVDDYNFETIKYDFCQTNNLFKFISKNFNRFAKSVDIRVNDFFISSCVIYTFPWKLSHSYRAINNGSLYENSANCKFTFANIDNEKVFIKVVNIGGQTSDYIIIDIINCILLEILYEKTKREAITIPESYIKPDIFNNYNLTDFVNKFNASFSSYSTANSWNYNELMDDKYNYDNFCQNIPSHYNKRCHIYMTNAINGKPETLRTLFKTYEQNRTDDNYNMIIKYFNSLKHVYNYIYFMGFHYGFLHNDLHQGNLLYDTHIDKLTIIDYGRNYIGYFYDNENECINNCIKNYHKILNYKNVYGKTQNPKTYKDMINIYKNSTTLRSVIKSNLNNGYMTHILDIITLSLSCLYYIDLIKHLQNDINDPKFLRLTNLIYFAKINGNNDYDDLYNKQLIISLTDTSMDEVKIIDTYILTKLAIINDIANNNEVEYYSFIYDGLFYTALLLHYFNLDGDDISDPRGGQIFYKSFQIIKNNDLITQVEINKFMSYLNNINQSYRYLEKINIYFKKMNIPNIAIPNLNRINGGENNNMSLKIKTSISSSNKSKFYISKEMQRVIDRLDKNDANPLPITSKITKKEISDIEILERYEEIFKDNNNSSYLKK